MARKQKWEAALLKVDELIASSNASLFDRATLLVQVWNDPDFLAHHKGNVDAAEEHLNQKLGDYGLGFFDVKALLEYFPVRDSWTAGNLRVMLASALEQEDAKRQQTAAPAVQRKAPVPRKEFEQLQKHAEFVQKQSESFQTEVQRLRQENENLRRELDKANGRIMELERMARGQFSAA